MAPQFKFPRGTPFWERTVRTPDGCLEWMGARTGARAGAGAGYGRITVAGREVGAHRRAYELTYGPIPDGMLVCHHCDNPPCVEPTHLFLGTGSDNRSDALRKGRLGTLFERSISDELVAAAQRLRSEGLSIREVARRTGISRSRTHDLVRDQPTMEVRDGD